MDKKKAGGSPAKKATGYSPTREVGRDRDDDLVKGTSADASNRAAASSGPSKKKATAADAPEVVTVNRTATAILNEQTKKVEVLVVEMDNAGKHTTTLDSTHDTSNDANHRVAELHEEWGDGLGPLTDHNL